MTLVDEKQAFGTRLKEALRKARLQANSPTWIAREFNLRYHGNPVTAPAIRKWLEGRALPSQDKMRVLALWLEVTPQCLRFGDSERKTVAKQEAADYAVDAAWVVQKLELLNEPHQKMVLEMVRALLRLEGKQ